MDIAITGKIDKQYNRAWPPIVDSIIIIDHPKHENKLFLGFVYKYLWDNKACIILLLNNLDYTEKILADHNIVDNELMAQGTIVLLPSYGWKYTNIDKLAKNFNTTCKEMENLVLQRKTEFEAKTILHDYPITRLDLMTHGIYSNRKKKEKEEQCDMDDDIKDQSLLTKKGEVDLDFLFRERNIDLYDPNEKFNPVSSEIKHYLKKKLKLAERIDDDEMRIIVNKNIAVRNIIDTQDDEINEGDKIIKWIDNNLKSFAVQGIKIFGDLKMAIHNGYVHIGRKGINVTDKITDNLVGNLKYLKWQYDIPIDYDTLKYILFQTKFQKQITQDNDQRLEVEKILSQEYLLCIHPEPKYLIWTVKRLIMAWYSDDVLTQNIRKIKVLINQWRGKPDEAFNHRYGIMPMIVIYPKYGKESARLCSTIIADHFVLYNNIAWSCSVPSYFIKMNDLMYYTNGHLDLKLYFRRVLEEHHGNVKNSSFNDELEKILGAENLLYPFEK
jgi:hypothetical protein